MSPFETIGGALFYVIITYLLAGIVVSQFFPLDLVMEIRAFMDEHGTPGDNMHRGFEAGRRNPALGSTIGVLFWPGLVLTVFLIRLHKRQIARREEQMREAERHIMADPWTTACLCKTCRDFRMMSRGSIFEHAPSYNDEPYPRDEINEVVDRLPATDEPREQ